jgi:hypothetical protein
VLRHGCIMPAMNTPSGITRRRLVGQGMARAAATPDAAPFLADEFAMVGVFGLDWLLDPRFTRLLDTLAASPGGVRAVRVFGALSLGRDRVAPLHSAGVWDGAGPPDFSRTLQALETLTSRGLTPFLPLTFFPPRISPTPARPPAVWDGWISLVRAFLDTIVSRFGASEVARWWFEVWNEPNMPPFWTGSFDQYLELYRVTSDAVAASGHPVRLGGPVLAYVPGEGPALMERFLAFLATSPAVRCDFVSLHRKGSWSNEEGEPDLDRLVRAADDTAQAILRLVPGRARGMTVVNDEADMMVGFDRPYAPRMTSQSVAWLAASMAAHDRLSVVYAGHGIRFRAASDNANQHLTRGPFDGRRTLMTPLADDPTDLVKLPVFGFYELLRLMGRRRLPSEAPPGVAHLATMGEAGMAALFSRYGPDSRSLNCRLDAVPWRRVNVVQFCIDAGHTGARPGLAAPAMRCAAELAVVEPIRRDMAPAPQTIALAPFGTVLLWVSPFQARAPAPPQWIEARQDGAAVRLRWTPSTDPAFYSYEVLRDGALISPAPLRSAMWVDDASGNPASLALRRRYAVRTVSASGVGSGWAMTEAAP